MASSGPVKEHSVPGERMFVSALRRWKGRNKVRKRTAAQAGAPGLRDGVGKAGTRRQYSTSNYRVEEFGIALPKMCHFGI